GTTGAGAGGVDATASPRRCAATAASPARTAPTIRLALTTLSRLVPLVVIVSSLRSGQDARPRREISSAPRDARERMLRQKGATRPSGRRDRAPSRPARAAAGADRSPPGP